MNKIAEQLKKLGEEIDRQTTQIETNMVQLEENKKQAVSEIFETNHEQNAIDIANYRDSDAKLKNAISILQQYRNELKQNAITLLNSII